MSPHEALRHFLIALGLGSLTGLYYGFLRPLRPRLTTLSDLLFCAGGFYAWLVLAFGVCRADIRPGCSSGLVIGAVVTDLTVGKLLRPVFFGFWRLISRILGIFSFPFKKILQKCEKTAKFIFATGRKAVIIKRNTKDGGTAHGRQKAFSPDPRHISTQLDHAEDFSDRCTGSKTCLVCVAGSDLLLD
jgi:hypothetical protein